MTVKETPARPAEIIWRTGFGNSRPEQRLRMACWGVALLLGAIDAWALRYQLNPDGVSYLDLADAFIRQGCAGLVNAYWSPIYASLLGGGLKIAGPAGRWDAPAGHFINFVIYLAALASFDFFLRGVLEARRRIEEKSAEKGAMLLPEWAFLSLGFALFTWTSLSLVTLSTLTPDLCVATFIYLVSGLVVRIHLGRANWTTFLALGVALGFGYLAKTVLFLMAFVFLGVAAALAVRRLGARTAAPRVAISLLVFLMVASPLVLALSRAQGRWTFGESGRINYGWYADHLPLYGEGEPYATPGALHPIHQLLSSPPVYEFATPIQGTYPLWDDPAYWWQGEQVHFDWHAQFEAIKVNVAQCYQILVVGQAGLIAALAVLLVFAAGRRWSVRELLGHWYLWIPALAGVGMYVPVHLESRFIAGEVALFWTAILLGIRLPPSPEARRVAHAATIAMLLTLGLQLGWQAIDDIKVGVPGAGKVQIEVADALKKQGLEPGDKVAVAGNGFSSFWARTARVSIIAEVPDYSDGSFWWAADPSVRARVFQALARSGAKLVVADRVPVPDWSADWQSLGDTGFYMHPLARP